MMEDHAKGNFRVPHHPAQPGMGMNPAERAISDREVGLRRSGLNQHNIARQEGPGRITKSARSWIRQPARQVAETQRIAGRHCDRLAAALHRSSQQPHTVKPGARIAAMQSKWTANQSLGFASQAQRGHWLTEG